MATENDIEDVWDDEDPDAEVSEINDTPVERLRIGPEKRNASLRIDKFLMNRLEGATRNKVQQAIEEGFIVVNGHPVKSNYKVKPEDEIIVYETRKPESSEIIAEQLPLDIVYEDDALMIINKPAGLVVHPGCGNYTGTLVNGVAWYLKQK